MTFDFYTLGEYSPCLSFTATGVNLWDQMCEAIAEHVLGADPYSEAAARDFIEIVEMDTADEEGQIDAVFVQGKLVGSLGSPFWLDPGQYVRI